jgi:hypothetical protein
MNGDLISLTFCLKESKLKKEKFTGRNTLRKILLLEEDRDFSIILNCSIIMS